MNIMIWFSDRDGLARTMPDPSIVVGGTALVRDLLGIVAQWDRKGRLSIAAPFVGRGIATGIAAWRSLPHERVDLAIVTQTVDDARCAREELESFPWRSLSIRVRHRLHAKLYVFATEPSGGACLVGSHNLSPAGVKLNHEAGVLFLGSRDSDIARVITACHEHIAFLARSGKKYFDSACWPQDAA